MSRRQEKTRLAFLSALSRLVATRGFDAITVTDIAAEADYGRWTFYQYFDSKEDAAWQAFVHWMRALDAHIIAAVEHLPHPQREYQSWRLIFHEFARQKGFFGRLGRLGNSEWRAKAKEFLVQQFSEHLRAGRFQLMGGARPELVARLYVASIMDLLEHWAQNPDLGEADALATEFFCFIFNQPPPRIP